MKLIVLNYQKWKYTIMPSRRKISSNLAELYRQYFNENITRDVK